MSPYGPHQFPSSTALGDPLSSSFRQYDMSPYGPHQYPSSTALVIPCPRTET
jgi:hypothetical protein